MSKDKGVKGVVKEVKDNLEEVTVTPGMARAMGGPVCTCLACGLSIPRYRGRYPKNCPDCGVVLLYKTGSEYTTKEV